MSSTEEAVSTAPAPAPAGRGRLLPTILVGVVCLGLGAGGAWFAAQRGAAPQPADAGHGGEETGHGAGATLGPAPLVDRVLNLDPFVVNLAGEGFQRFLKARIEIETASPGDRKELAERTAQLRDAVIVVLSSKRLEDLDGFEGKAMLKNELHERLADIAGPDRIRSVLITEFVIQ